MKTAKIYYLYYYEIFLQKLLVLKLAKTTEQR